MFRALPRAPYSLLKVLVIIPVRSSESTIGRCLAALRTANFRDFECLVVDEGSTDWTGEIGGRTHSQGHAPGASRRASASERKLRSIHEKSLKNWLSHSRRIGATGLENGHSESSASGPTCAASASVREEDDLVVDFEQVGEEGFVAEELERTRR